MTRKEEQSPPRVREWFEYVELSFYLAMFAMVALLPMTGSSAGATAVIASALILTGLSFSAAARIYRRRHPLSMREVLGCRLTQERVALIRSWSLLGSESHAVSKVCQLFPELSAAQANSLLGELVHGD